MTTPRRLLVPFWIVGAVIILLLGCSDESESDGGGNGPASFIGSWDLVRQVDTDDDGTVRTHVIGPDMPAYPASMTFAADRAGHVVEYGDTTRIEWEIVDGCLELYYLDGSTRSIFCNYTLEECELVIRTYWDQGGNRFQYFRNQRKVCNLSPEPCVSVDPDTGYTTTLFSFDASCSSDPNDAPEFLTYSWDWNGDGEIDVGPDSNPVVLHLFTSPGRHRVDVHVTDPDGASVRSFVDVTVVSTTDITMITVPAGTFTMGDDEANCADTHEVSLTRDYELSEYEITVGQYASMANWALTQGLIEVDGWQVSDVASNRTLFIVNQSLTDLLYSANHISARPGRESNPVRSIMWYGAAAYCNWLNQFQGGDPTYDPVTWSCNSGDPYTAVGYRLPTDAEWEHAARYPDGRPYPWGATEPTAETANWNRGFSGDTLTRVGSFPAGVSALGFHDMAGNAYEWVHDWLGCHLGADAVIDPVGSESSGSRPVRGGSYSTDEAMQLRCTFRLEVPGINGVYQNSYGLRIARTIP